ncbi:MAG: hypothetical protein HXY53_10055 [Nitrospirae bacterium]|nr:hypothetical protein [Nitrospirota bacterium]
MKYKITFCLLFAFIFFSTTACGETFRGKVIDADTKEPIEGAVVVASWLEERATPAGPTSRLKDVKETLTDKNGEWVIKGPKGRDGGNITAIFTFLTGTYYTLPPEFIVFKPGYCSYPAGFGIETCKEKMKTYNFTKSENIGEIVELRKLTIREDRLKVLPSPVAGENSLKKQGQFIRLINEESKHLGIPKAYYEGD